MARPREFDEEAVLDAAVQCFWANGYEGASVRENGDLVETPTEAEQHGVSAEAVDIGMGAEACVQFGERDGTVVLVDLHRITTAERDMGPG